MELGLAFVLGAALGALASLLVWGRGKRATRRPAPAPEPPPAAPAPAVAVKRVVLDEGAANVLNALNNRLAAIGALADLLRGSPLDTAATRALTLLHGEVRTAAGITEHFLELTGPRGGAVEPSDLLVVIREVLAGREAKLKELQVQLVRAVPERLPSVACPRPELTEILTRLVDFSVRRLRETQPPRELRIEAAASASAVTVAFADSGPPLSVAAEQQLASPFRSPKSSGSAEIDYAMAGALAHASGGALRLRPSTHGATGAELELTLPRSPLEARVPAAAPAALPALPKLRVLVVEDDIANRQVLRSLLEREGHDVVAVENGMEAMERLAPRDVTFDVVISDIRMPRLGGRALYEQLSERRPELAHRFVFVTGDQAREDTRQFLKDCGQPVVLKPYGLDELLAAIGTVVARKK